MPIKGNILVVLAVAQLLQLWPVLPPPPWLVCHVSTPGLPHCDNTVLVTHITSYHEIRASVVLWKLYMKVWTM